MRAGARADLTHRVPLGGWRGAAPPARARRRCPYTTNFFADGSAAALGRLADAVSPPTMRAVRLGGPRPARFARGRAPAGIPPVDRILTRGAERALARIDSLRTVCTGVLGSALGSAVSLVPKSARAAASAQTRWAACSAGPGALVRGGAPLRLVGEGSASAAVAA